MSNHAVPLLALVLTLGCTSTVRRPSVPLLGATGLAPAGSRATDQEIRDVLSLRPGSGLPARLAIARVQACETSPASANSLTPLADGEHDAWRDALRSPGTFPRVGVVSSLLSRNATVDLRDLRFEAAKQLRADYLLVYRLEHDEGWFNNPLSLLYATIVGSFFVPGTVYENHTVGKAALVDVRSGYIAFAVEADSRLTRLGAPFVGHPLDVLRREAENNVLEKLRARIGEEVSRSTGELSGARAEIGVPRARSGEPRPPRGMRYSTENHRDL